MSIKPFFLDGRISVTFLIVRADVGYFGVCQDESW